MGVMNSDIGSYYAQRAAEYERIYKRPERQRDLAAVRDRVATVMSGQRVLEIACGTGYWTEVMAPVAESVLATDRAPEVLNLARVKRYGDAPVSFAQVDAFDLGAVAGPFTAAFAGFWWSHVPRTARASFLKQLHRRLQPGAVVLFVDNRYVPGSSTPLSRCDADGNTYQRRLLSDGSEHEVMKNFPSPSELRAVVGPQARMVRVTEWTYYWELYYRTPAGGEGCPNV